MNTSLKIEHNFNLLNNLNKDSLTISSYIDKDNKAHVVSKYSDNIWDFSKKTIKNKSSWQNKIFFNKHIFSNGEKLIDHLEILNTLKDCCLKMLSQGLKPQTVFTNKRDLFKFLDYMFSELNLKSPSDMTKEQIHNYADFYIKHNVSKSFQHIRCSILIVKNTLYKYRNEINNGIYFEPFENINIKRKLETITTVKNIKQTEIIPDNVWQEISSKCEIYLDEYLKNKENELNINDIYYYKLKTCTDRHSFSNIYKSKEYETITKRFKNSKEHFTLLNKTQISAGIIIQSYTGMRISELLSLETNCIINENITIDNKKHQVRKIKGLTFKHQGSTALNDTEGKDANWLCPPIVEKAVDVLTCISDKTRYLYQFHIENGNNKKHHDRYKQNMNSLFLKIAMTPAQKQETHKVHLNYKKFLLDENIEIDFKISSHCFRRTFARFFARSIIDIPIEALKEQFKHYSSDITEYYMKEDKTADHTFMELMEGYSDAKLKGDTENQLLLFKEMKNSFDSAIITASNIDDLLAISSGKQVKVINEYLVQLDNDKPLNPLESLTCNGIIILPTIHIKYWKEMLTLYDELLDLEPNSIWYEKERSMIKDVVDKLNKNEAYICGGTK